MEKQLGIDWEHREDLQEFDDSLGSDLNQQESVQTDMMRDGYLNAQQSNYSESPCEDRILNSSYQDKLLET
jgi:hypothetical protein